MPRRPARPVSWVYSPGVRSTCASPLNLTSRSSTTERAGMLMPSASVSVAKTALTRPADEQLLDHLLERRQQPGVVGGQAALQPVAATPSSRARARSSPGDAARCAPRPPGGSRPAPPAVVSRRPAARHCWTAASQPARLKMNMIAGSSPSRSSRSTTSDAGRRQRRPAAGRPRPPRRRRLQVRPAGHLPGVAQQLRVHVVLLRPPSASWNRSNIRRPTSMCCQSGTGRCS